MKTILLSSIIALSTLATQTSFASALGCTQLVAGHVIQAVKADKDHSSLGANITHVFVKSVGTQKKMYRVTVNTKEKENGVTSDLPDRVFEVLTKKVGINTCKVLEVAETIAE